MDRQAKLDKEKESIAAISALLAQNKPREAVPIAQEVVQSCRELFGDEHEETALALHQLAYCYFCDGRYVSARQNNEDALAIRRKVFGNQHLYTALSLKNLGLSLRELGLFDEVLACHKEALSIFTELQGAESVEAADEAACLAFVLSRLEDYAGPASITRRPFRFWPRSLASKTRHPRRDAATRSRVHSAQRIRQGRTLPGESAPEPILGGGEVRSRDSGAAAIGRATTSGAKPGQDAAALRRSAARCATCGWQSRSCRPTFTAI